MPSEGENEEPYASEYAEKGSPNDRDYDEVTNVEHNASVTKLLTTQGIRDSNESMNADAENTIARDTLKQLKTVLMRKEKRPETLIPRRDTKKIIRLAQKTNLWMRSPCFSLG